MRKILSLLGAMTLSTIASTSVIACEKKDEPKPPLPPTPIEINLSTIIRTTSFGKITMTGSIPTKEELLKAIKDNNLSAKSLTINDFDFKQGSPTAINAIISGKNNYKGEITLTYTKYTRIDLNINTLQNNLHFLKAMTGREAYNELRLKIKDLSNGVYKDNDEIKNDDTMLISIWVAPNNCLTELIDNAFGFVDKVDVKIKVTENNKTFKKMDLITLSQIEIFNS